MENKEENVYNLTDLYNLEELPKELKLTPKTEKAMQISVFRLFKYRVFILKG